MRKGFAIVVVIPALNEEAALPGVIARIPEWVDRILVVDNGSTDRTAAAALAAGASVVSEPTRGYGRACQTGIAAALSVTGRLPDVMVFLDADGSDFPEQMERIVDPILTGQADFVIGSRTRGSLSAGAMTPPQRFGNMLAPTLIRLLWGERYTDLGPFRAIRATALRSLHMDDNTYGWTVQMQIRAARARLRAVEVPVDYARRKAGKSKISGTFGGVIRAGTKILQCVAQEWWRPSPLAQPTLALGIFAKHPEPGKAKTRLIPALGAQGAADLHDQLVRHTLQVVDRVGLHTDASPLVWTAGSDPAEFARHFGTNLPCVAQSEGDLGGRMDTAFRSMLARASAAVLIGTDCPDLSPEILANAFTLLDRADLVLGPARDGGYYLIGLRRPVPALFENMKWSTSSVLSQTLERAAELGLRVRLLPQLSDVDEPADLSVWDRVRATQATPTASPDLSIVIPTLNEASGIEQLVRSIAQPGIEVIVSDGGSTDGTPDLASACGARVVFSPRGRGNQLNAGASLAHAPLLLFLHADTTLPDDFLPQISTILADSRVSLGAFRFRLDRRGVLLRAVEHAVRLRCAAFGMPYGDQAMFIRREAFVRLGAFAQIPLMEDVDLVRRARRIGRVKVSPAHATTSARRWIDAGVIRMSCINLACLLGFSLGISPMRLAAWRNTFSCKVPN